MFQWISNLFWSERKTPRPRVIRKVVYRNAYAPTEPDWPQAAKVTRHAPQQPAAARPTKHHRATHIVTRERIVAIRTVLRQSDRPLMSREILSRVRKITKPPVYPGKSEAEAFRHLLVHPTLRPDLILTGRTLAARWSLKPLRLAQRQAPTVIGKAAIAPKPKRRKKAPTLAATLAELQAARRELPRKPHVATAEMLAVARMVLLASPEPLRMKAWHERVNARLSPKVVQHATFCWHASQHPELFQRVGIPRSPSSRWTLAGAKSRWANGTP